MTMKEDVRDQIDECLDRVEALELKLQKRNERHFKNLFSVWFRLILK